MEEEIEVLLGLVLTCGYLDIWERPYSEMFRFLGSSSFTTMWIQVDSIIERSDLLLCLTSKYVYIRECKKWQESNLNNQ